MKVTIRVEDRITRLNQALHSGVARETPEKQAELEAELLFLRELSRQGAGNAPLAAPYQSGQSWAVPGCAGFYETEAKARLRSIELTALEAGVEVPRLRLEGPATLFMPGALAESLRILAATGDGARHAKHLLEAADQLQCLQRIFEELDGQPWSPDAFDNIAGYLSAAGLDVRDCNDLVEPESSGPSANL